MNASITLKEILETAIQKEISAQEMYRDLSNRVTEASAREVLLEIVQHEEGHQKMLEKYLRGEMKEGALSHRHAVDYRLAEHFEQPEMSAGMELKDIFLLAANREKHSHELYLELAAIHPDGNVRQLLENLALQELGHKHRVEFLYTEVAFPQTDGG